jgi:hypothetical protein
MNLTYSVKVRKDGKRRGGRDGRTPIQAKKELYDKRSIQPGELKTPCWLWTGWRNKRGYGVMGFRNKPWRVNRLSWLLHKGKIPPGKEICHRCNAPSCFRPSHLFAGTHLQNMQQAFRQNRIPIKKGEKSGLAKLTDKDVIEIRRRYIPNSNCRSLLAKQFSVSDDTIYLIGTYQLWKHVKQPSLPKLSTPGIKTHFGSDHCHSKLTDDLVIKIRKTHKPGKIGYRTLASMFGIHRATAAAVVRRKTWRHI